MTNRGKCGTWDEQIMERALAAYCNGDMGLNFAARTYNVPKATLKRRIDVTNINAVGHKSRSSAPLTGLTKLKMIY
jgi:hypothetical protein